MVAFGIIVTFLGVALLQAAGVTEQLAFVLAILAIGLEILFLIDRPRLVDHLREHKGTDHALGSGH
jgi:hypothetical protein